jgi:hypothetical protein
MSWLKALRLSYSGRLIQMIIYPFCGERTSVEWVSGVWTQRGSVACLTACVNGRLRSAGMPGVSSLLSIPLHSP